MQFIEQQTELAGEVTKVKEAIASGFKESLERQKAEFREDLEFKKSNMRPRHLAYLKLWALLKPLRASGNGHLSDQERDALTSDLTYWYHDKGGGGVC